MKLTLLHAAAVLSFVGTGNAQAGPWGQCGGGTVGNIGCVSGWCCQYVNEWYSQCLESCTGNPATTSSKTTTKTPSTTKASTTTSRLVVTTTKTTTGKTGPTTGVDKLVGYGEGTTGGGSGAGTTVTSCSALIAAVKLAGVVKINGILSGCGIVRVPANTSILGVGSNSGLTGGGFKIVDTSNVIIRNLKFYMAIEKGDLVALENAQNVWVDHCEFWNAGITGDKDFYDGLLDTTRGSDFITYSWNKFHDHWKGSLVGNGDDLQATDKGKFHITYHHNSFNNINSRLPSNRFGSIHVYNCCYWDIPTSAVNSRMGGQVLVENTSFTDVNRAIITNYGTTSTDEEGYATERGNLFLGDTNISISRSNGFSVPYSYTLDPVAGVCALIASKGGAGVVTF